MALITFLIYLAYLVIFSLITFITFGKDKKMATSNSGPVRIKEKRLLGLVSLGGAVGGFLGRIVFHHKTNKIYFTISIYFSLLLQIVLLVLFALRALSIF